VDKDSVHMDFFDIWHLAKIELGDYARQLFSNTNKDGRLAAILFPNFMLKHVS